MMFVKAILALASYSTVFGYLLHLPQCSAWNRGQTKSFFDGALFYRQNVALKTDILRKVKTFGEIQCALVCLSENDCVAQTYCTDASKGKNYKGTCYLHKNGVKNEQNRVRLVKSKGCTFQQYMDLEVSCSRKCQHGMKCYHDYGRRRCESRCEPPYTGIYCNQPQVISVRFTTLGAQGNSGPISTAEYVNTTLQGAVTLVKGVQIWRVPFTGPYKLTVAGASGGNASCSSGGKGAIAVGMVQLTKGTVLHLLIGQKGLPGASGAGGGGGTFVVSNKNTLLVAAGGGGGGGGQILSENGDDGQAAKNGSVYGGVNGLGGSVCAGEDNNAGGGAGFKGNGTCSRNVSCSLSPHPCNESGLAYVNGGLGGDGNGVGGFGGGGAAYNDFGGGGGGYSGGGVSATSYGSRAGGGGSYWSVGLKASNETNSGDGYVLIESRMV